MRLVMVVLALGAAYPLAHPAGDALGATPARPNIIVLMTDDQTQESMKVMPKTRALLGSAGTTFANSFVSLSLCCPSRATFLTGQYAHNHHVLSNKAPTGGYSKLNHANTLAVWLRRAGYRAAFVGKYLNGYPPAARPLEIPPGWADWLGAVGGITDYFNYRMNDNGRPLKFGSAPTDYKTDMEARHIEGVIRAAAQARQPLFLWAGLPAPHAGGESASDPNSRQAPVPAPRHAGRFASVPLPRPPSFNEANVSDKPTSIRRLPALTPAAIALAQSAYRKQLESLLAVDDAVASTVTALQQTGELSNTVLIFTSDNAFMNGQHRQIAKSLPYEPSIRVPLLIRGPGFPAGRHVRQPVANVDLAPTIMALAHAQASRVMDGVSLLSLAHNARLGGDRALLLEGPVRRSERVTVAFKGVRTARYKYVEYVNGERELYDLVRDPDELTNQARNPAFASIRSRLAARLRTLRGCRGAACRGVRF